MIAKSKDGKFYLIEDGAKEQAKTVVPKQNPPAKGLKVGLFVAGAALVGASVLNSYNGALNLAAIGDKIIPCTKADGSPCGGSVSYGDVVLTASGLILLGVAAFI